jgi:hypothetical protein
MCLVDVCSTKYIVFDMSSFQLLRKFRCFIKTQILFLTLLRNLFYHYDYLNFLTSQLKMELLHLYSKIQNSYLATSRAIRINAINKLILF